MKHFTAGSIHEDFFSENPHWKYLDSSKQLLKDSPENASKIRWAVYLMLDPSSPYFRYPVRERFRTVTESYLKNSDYFQFDENFNEITSDAFQYVIDKYASETMSKVKRDYFEREHSYSLLVQQERVHTDLKVKAEVQLKMSKIYESLMKSKLEFEQEDDVEEKSQGKAQPGLLFE